MLLSLRALVPDNYRREVFLGFPLPNWYGGMVGREKGRWVRLRPLGLTEHQADGWMSGHA